MKNTRWEEKSLEERKAVWEVYQEVLFEKEGWRISFKQCDEGWVGCSWTTIKYTFGVKY